MQHWVETKIEQEGQVTLTNLPFHKGEVVEVVISTRLTKFAPAYSLRGLPVQLEQPFEPVAEDDWSALHFKKKNYIFQEKEFSPQRIQRNTKV